MDSRRVTLQLAAPPSEGRPKPTYETLAYLAQRAREAADATRLGFVAANETFRLARYRQAFVFLGEPGAFALHAVSGVSTIAEDTPMLGWLKRLAARVHAEDLSTPRWFTVDDVDPAFAEGWAEWLPETLLVYALPDPQGRPVGTLWLAFGDDEDVDDAQTALISQAAEVYGYGFWALSRTRPALGATLLGQARRFRWWLAALALIVASLPVRMSVLGAAEVVPLQPFAVASPQDGVIGDIAVTPSQAVRRGDLLFTLDDTTLRNRRAVAQKQLAVARADALAAAQKAFESDQSKAEIATLNGRVAERESELVYLDELLKRLEVRAERDGVAVFGDPADWQGKPVVTGERVMLLADPGDAGVLVWMPVADAISLEPGAEVRLFLRTRPLTPVAARLDHASYQASLSPEGVAAYRVRATFDPQESVLPRIGLQGTAKIYGDRAPLAYYLLRRPIAAARTWLGW
jgi:hypothetical protein